MNADRTLLEMKYAQVVELLAQEAPMSRDAALRLFYASRTYSLMSEGVSDLHCRSDLYLVEEILDEFGLLGR